MERLASQRPTGKGPSWGAPAPSPWDSSGVGKFDVTWPSRAEEPNGRTSPEELIAAAHSSCFSMALSHGLAGAGMLPESVQTQASVTFQPGEGITGILISVKARVPGISAEDLGTAAETAKANCPVSKALAGAPIALGRAPRLDGPDAPGGQSVRSVRTAGAVASSGRPGCRPTVVACRPPP